MAARLQKVATGITFCCSRRGFNYEGDDRKGADLLILKRVAVRGVSERELVYVMRDEFDTLADETRTPFSDP